MATQEAVARNQSESNRLQRIRHVGRLLGIGLMAATTMVAFPLPASAGRVTYTLENPDNHGHYTCFGHTGTFRKGSHVLVVRWNGTTIDECFGIAADRSIWHTWARPRSWVKMPNNGYADDMVDAFRFVYTTEGSDRWVRVCVKGDGIWAITMHEQTNVWYWEWFRNELGGC